MNIPTNNRIVKLHTKTALVIIFTSSVIVKAVYASPEIPKTAASILNSRNALPRMGLSFVPKRRFAFPPKKAELPVNLHSTRLGAI
jgi:hypothetical protein